MSKNEVAEAKNTNLEASYDYGEMAHEGFEETSIQDLSIPFLVLLQSLSPEVADDLIPGAKAGDLMNTVTKEIIEQPLRIIPVYKEEAWVRWVPRNKGGGLKGRYEPASPQVQQIIKNNGGSRVPPKDAEGKSIPFKDPEDPDVEVIETHYMYCLTLNEDGTETEGYIVIPFSSTKIKVFRDWVTAMYLQKGRPPMFANRCAVSSQKQKSDSGTFFNFKIGPLRDTYRESLIHPVEERHLLEEAKKFSEMIKDGIARPSFESIDPNTQDGEIQSSSQGETDEEIPF